MGGGIEIIDLGKVLFTHSFDLGYFKFVRFLNDKPGCSQALFRKEVNFTGEPPSVIKEQLYEYNIEAMKMILNK